MVNTLSALNGMFVVLLKYGIYYEQKFCTVIMRQNDRNV